MWEQTIGLGPTYRVGNNYLPVSTIHRAEWRKLKTKGEPPPESPQKCLVIFLFGGLPIVLDEDSGRAFVRMWLPEAPEGTESPSSDDHMKWWVIRPTDQEGA